MLRCAPRRGSTRPRCPRSERIPSTARLSCRTGARCRPHGGVVFLRLAPKFAREFVMPGQRCGEMKTPPFIRQRNYACRCVRGNHQHCLLRHDKVHAGLSSNFPTNKLPHQREHCRSVHTMRRHRSALLWRGGGWWGGGNRKHRSKFPTTSNSYTAPQCSMQRRDFAERAIRVEQERLKRFVRVAPLECVLYHVRIPQLVFDQFLRPEHTSFNVVVVRNKSAHNVGPQAVRR